VSNYNRLRGKQKYYRRTPTCFNEIKFAFMSLNGSNNITVKDFALYSQTWGPSHVTPTVSQYSGPQKQGPLLACKSLLKILF
jgi:hypothetical protein